MTRAESLSFAIVGIYLSHKAKRWAATASLSTLRPLLLTLYL